MPGRTQPGFVRKPDAAVSPCVHPSNTDAALVQLRADGDPEASHETLDKLRAEHGDAAFDAGRLKAHLFGAGHNGRYRKGMDVTSLPGEAESLQLAVALYADAKLGRDRAIRDATAGA
jgi:hypothetical protein